MDDKRLANPAPGYNGFADVVREAEAAIMAGAPGFAGYGAEPVGRRLLQRIVELGLSPFLQDSAARRQRGDATIPADGAFEAGGLRFDTASRHVTITPALWLRSLAEFGAQWLRILAVVSRAALRKPRAPAAPAVLLFGVGVDDLLPGGSDRRFMEFCRGGPIEPLRDAGHLIVECPKSARSSQPAYCIYAKYPLFELVAEHPARGGAWLRFLAEHLATALSFATAAVRRPLAAILARDAAFHAMLAHLSRAQAIGAVVVTNSNYHVQPLWMRALAGRRFATHMVWYSQNSIPFAFRWDGIRSFLPNHRYMEVDEIWVWTSGFGEYLRARGARGSVRVVGPILWYLPDAVDMPAEAIAVFDVSPLVPAHTAKAGLTYNYYRADNVRQFMADIVAARDAVERQTGRCMPIVLKHKRSHAAHHDAGYLRFIDELEKSGAVQTVPVTTNLYGMISAAAVTVVIPYSSPAYVASWLGVPAIYYDPAEELVPTHEPCAHVSFAAGAEALRRALAALAAGRSADTVMSEAANGGPEAV